MSRRPPAKGCMSLLSDSFLGRVYCAATATARREDGWYCGWHDPVRVAARAAARAARQEARDAASRAQWARDEQRRQDIVAIVRAVAQSGPFDVVLPELFHAAERIVAEWDTDRELMARLAEATT